jgi:hypothetical protein
MTVPDLARLERVDLRQAWLSEPADFTPWLARAENLALLAESLGIALELDSTEKSVGPFAADILCKNPITEQWVLIENQLEPTDHTHLGQVITYAAGLDAVTVIWIAGKFVEEHRAALDWLNEITSQGVNFFGVEIELWRIGDATALAPKFNLVSKPNSWSKQVAKGPREGRKWDEASFFAALGERLPAAVSPARAILAWAKEKMPDLWWGEGHKDGAFYPGLHVGSDWHMIVCAWTYGRLEFQFERMKYRPVFDKPDKRLELLRKLNDEVGLNISVAKIDLRPSVELATFNDPGKLQALFAVLDWYVAEIRGSDGE